MRSFLGMITVFAWAVTLYGSNPATAQDQQRSARETFINRIKANDKNGDGKITKEEASDQLKQRFDNLDTDGDGTIDEDEFARFAERIRSNPQNANPRRTSGGRPVAVPDGVEFTADVAYREGNDKWRLDLALPKQRGEALRPAIVFVHGGGWRSGDKGGGVWRSLPLQYAAKGYVCVSVNYRLTDEATFPACVEDVKCAVRWLRAHADQYHLDPQRIGAYGNSAGAHLVAMLGLAGPDAGLEGDGPFQDQSSLVQAVCCSATPTDFTNWGGARGNRISNQGLLRGDEETLADRAKRASPIHHVKAAAPPFLVVHGTDDGTVPVQHGDRFVEALKKAGATDVTYMRYEGAGHGVFNQHAQETHPAMETFFQRTIGNPETE